MTTSRVPLRSGFGLCLPILRSGEPSGGTTPRDRHAKHVKWFSEFLRNLVTAGFADKRDAPYYLELVASNILSTATWTLVGIL